METTNISSLDIRNEINPFPDQTPEHIFSRKRLIVSSSLASPLPNTINTAGYSVWNLIKNNVQFRSALTYFKGVRADIKLSLVIRAATGNYGMYSLSYMYGNNFTPDLYNMLSLETVVGDIATNEAIELTIPYRHPWHYLDNSSLTSDDGYATIYITNWFSASLDGGSASLTFDLFATLENVSTGIFTSDAFVYPQSDLRVATIPRFGEVARGYGTLATVAGAVGTVYASNLAGHTYDYLRGQFVSYANKKVQETIHNTVDEKLGKKQDKTAGSATNVRQTYYGDLSTLGQTSCTPTLDVWQQPPILFDPSPFKMSSDMLLADVAKIPGIMGTYRFLSTDAKNTNYKLTLQLHKGVGTVSSNWSYAAYLSRFFRYYRGDHKVTLTFHTSPLIAARFKVMLKYYSNPSFDTNAEDTYELPTDVFLVRGNVTRTYTVPYHSPYPLIPCSTSYAYLEISLLEPPSTASALDTTVYMVAMHSLDNAEFYSPQSARTTNTPAQKGWFAVKQMNIRERHAQKSDFSFGGTMTNVPCHIKPIMTVVDTIRRYDNNVSAVDSIDTLNAIASYTDWNAACNLVKITLPFAFISGSIENRVVYTGTAVPTKRAVHLSNFMSGANSVGDGSCATIDPAWPVLDYRTPYIAAVPFIPRQENATFRPVHMADAVLAPGGTIEAYLVRAGSDFGVHYPNALPPASLWSKL